MKIDKTQLEEARASGFRPVIVGCITFRNKVLFLYQKKYKIWQLPQGGIEPNEEPKEALKRELIEELGDFSTQIDFEQVYILGEDKVEFPEEQQGKRELYDAEGKEHFMKGKRYFFAHTKAKDTQIDINNTEFEKYKWVTKEEARKLIESIYQPGKKRITQKALKLLTKQFKI